MTPRFHRASASGSERPRGRAMSPSFYECANCHRMGILTSARNFVGRISDRGENLFDSVGRPSLPAAVLCGAGSLVSSAVLNMDRCWRRIHRRKTLQLSIHVVTLASHDAVALARGRLEAAAIDDADAAASVANDSVILEFPRQQG